MYHLTSFPVFITLLVVAFDTVSSKSLSDSFDVDLVHDGRKAREERIDISHFYNGRQYQLATAVVITVIYTLGLMLCCFFCANCLRTFRRERRQNVVFI